MALSEGFSRISYGPETLGTASAMVVHFIRTIFILPTSEGLLNVMKIFTLMARDDSA